MIKMRRDLRATCLWLLLAVPLAVPAQTATGQQDGSTDDAAPTGTATPAADPGSDTTGDAGTSDATPPADPAAELADLTITVTQTDNTPIADAKVQLSYGAGKERQGKTDALGMLVVEDIPYGAAEVRASATGMKSGVVGLTIDGPALAVPLQLESRPLPGPAAD